MRARVARFLIFVMIVGALIWFAFPRPDQSAAPAKRQVVVAAASNLKFALSEIVEEFEAKHSDIQVKVAFGSSGNFFSQLSNNAPFDVFLSADVDYPRRLIEQGQANRDSRFTYAIGRLVVWAPNNSSIDLNRLGIKALADPRIRKIAIANPKHAPYGRAAEATLKHYDLFNIVKDRLVFGDSIVQVAQFVESGAADIGLIAQSLALAPNMKDQGRIWEVPIEAYPAMEQAGVILNWASDKPAAAAFRDFLTNAEGRTILRKFGFNLPGE